MFAVLVAAAAAAAGSLQYDIRKAFGPLGSDKQEILDNRVGFSFASLSIGSEDGEDSTIGGSKARIAAVAKVLKEHDDVRLIIEGHVGLSAPPEIAQAFSEQRAHIVAQAIEDLGVQADRMQTRGWGKRVAENAQGSPHPNARAAKAGYGWAELFLIAPPLEWSSYSSRLGSFDNLELPKRPDYYFVSATADDTEVDSSGGADENGERPLAAPPPAPRAQPSTYPIFYMSPTPAVGASFGLHFFEPRYRLLIKRVMAADKAFIYCSHAPFHSAERSSFNLPLGMEPTDDECVSVLVDDAVIYNDGSADVSAHAVRKVTLGDVLLEPGTGGLFSVRTTHDASPNAAWPPVASGGDALPADRPCLRVVRVALSLLLFSLLLTLMLILAAGLVRWSGYAGGLHTPSRSVPTPRKPMLQLKRVKSLRAAAPDADAKVVVAI